MHGDSNGPAFFPLYVGEKKCPDTSKPPQNILKSDSSNKFFFTQYPPSPPSDPWYLGDGVPKCAIYAHTIHHNPYNADLKKFGPQGMVTLMMKGLRVGRLGCPTLPPAPMQQLSSMPSCLPGRLGGGLQANLFGGAWGGGPGTPPTWRAFFLRRPKILG